MLFRSRIAKSGGTPGVVSSQLRAAMYIVELVNNPKVKKTLKKSNRDALVEGMGLTEAEAKDMLNK